MRLIEAYVDQEEGAPSSLVENEEEILQAPKDSGSDYNLNCIEANVKIFPIVILRLKRKLS